MYIQEMIVFMKKCPIEQTIKLIGSKWKLLIIRELLDQKRGFEELKKELYPISAKVLNENLRDMQKYDLVKKKIINEKPLSVEYQLTELGRTIEPIMNELKIWGLNYQENYKNLHK